MGIGQVGLLLDVPPQSNLKEIMFLQKTPLANAGHTKLDRLEYSQETDNITIVDLIINCVH